MCVFLHAIYAGFVHKKFLLYLYKYIIRPCMEYCRNVWVSAPNSYLDILAKLQKWECRTVGEKLAASLEPLGCCRNVANLSLFYMNYFGRFSFELDELFPLPFSRWRSSRYSERLHIFSITFLFSVSRMYSLDL